MSTIEERVGEPRPIEKDYVDIIRSDVLIERQYVAQEGQPARIVYYCRMCKALVAPKRVGKKFQFSCGACGKEVSFGTIQSIENFYRITVPTAS